MPAPENAVTGWEAYRDGGYEMTLEDINSELSSRGLAPVSPRMFTHYRKLHRYGYEQYIPINQLDVRTMEDPVWDRALRGRYPLYQVEARVRVIMLPGDQAIILDGLAQELSDGEVVMRLDGASAVEAFQGKRAIWTLEVIFVDTGEIRLCEVAKVTLDRQRRRVTVRASFLAIEPSEEAVRRTGVPTRAIRLVVGGGSEGPLLGRTTQQLFWTFSATEQVRMAAAEMLRSLDSGQQFSLPGNRVRRLSVASPLEAVIVAGVPVALGLEMLVTKAVEARKAWWEGTKAKYEAGIAQEEVARLRWERERREALSAIDVSDVTEAMSSSVQQGIGAPTVQSPTSEEDTLARQLVGQALAPLGELLEAGGGTVEVELIDDPQA